MLRISYITLCIGLAPMAAAAEDAFENAEQVFQAFEDEFGVTEGKRRNHTKDICFEGEFSPAESSILEYTNSPIFTSTSSVLGHVSHKGGNDLSADDKHAAYGLAVEITTLEEDVDIMTMNTEDFFPVSTSEAFTELMQAKVAGGRADWLGLNI